MLVRSPMPSPSSPKARHINTNGKRCLNSRKPIGRWLWALVGVFYIGFFVLSVKLTSHIIILYNILVMLNYNICNRILGKGSDLCEKKHLKFWWSQRWLPYTHGYGYNCFIIIFRDFVRICNLALDLNGRLISADQLEYQEALRTNFRDMTDRLSDIFGEQVWKLALPLTLIQRGVIHIGFMLLFLWNGKNSSMEYLNFIRIYFTFFSFFFFFLRIYFTNRQELGSVHS